MWPRFLPSVKQSTIQLGNKYKNCKSMLLQLQIVTRTQKRRHTYSLTRDIIIKKQQASCIYVLSSKLLIQY